MRLHENREILQDAILAASQALNIPEIYIEKDYWVTLALYEIFHSQLAAEAVFKGGTALSKCYKLIDRFSEDIDLVVIRNKGENDNQLKKKIRSISLIVGAILPEIEVDGVTNKFGNIRKTVHKYDKIYKGNFGQIRDQIVLEATWLGNSEPFTNKPVSCYVTDMMQKNKQFDLIKEYNLQPFNVKVLTKERTLCEKIMSLVRFSRQEEPYMDLANKIRHIYDIHMMLKNEDIIAFFGSDDFNKMLLKVGHDDVLSFKNNNEWLREHPAKAIIFDQPEKTWENIKATYFTTFKELLIGQLELPKESDLINTLKSVSERLKTVVWDIKV